MKKLIAGVALVTAFAGCEQPQSRLDKVISKGGAEPSATPPAKADHSGSIEERLARLEESNAKNAEALDFLNKVYNQQKQQQQQQQREEPAPDAVFAVDISADVKAGQVEGSPQALITIVEAWDFA